MRIFVSFTGHDREVKNGLVEALKNGVGDDIEIWESDEKCASDYSSECIKGIDGSQLFVVLISAFSMDPSSYVINEVVEARKLEGQGKLNIILYNIDGSPLNDTFRFQLNHVSEVNSVFLSSSGETAGAQEVVKRAVYLLALRKEGRPEYTMTPEIDAFSPGKPTNYFVEGSRDDIFSEIDGAFERSNVIFLEQISGYGKKSAARKYAEKYADSFKNVYIFPSFHGSLREFLLNGLKLKNRYETGIEILSDNDKLLKKRDVLKAFDKGTLLIVPEITIDKKDDQTVFDILSEVGCRIIFITRNVPSPVSAVFPRIFVGRMNDRYLFDLFFHYYSCDELKKPEFEAPLSKYFDAVGGHTKTIELTASVMSDEYIYEDEFFNTLDQIASNGQKGVAGRVSDAISEIFSIKEFDETERQILWCASALARIPLDEEIFVDTLKEAGCFDSAKLRGLVEKSWIDDDRAARIVSVDEFLSNVCLSKIKPHVETVKACCDSIIDILSWAYMGFEVGTLKSWLGVLEKVFAGLGMPFAAQAAEELHREMFGDAAEREDIETLLANISREEKRSEYGEATKELIELLRSAIKIRLSLFDATSRNNGTIYENFISSLIVDCLVPLSDLENDVEEDPYVLSRTLIEQVIKDPGAAPAHVISFADSFLQISEKFDEEDIDFICYTLSVILNIFLHFLDDPYIKLRVCEARLKIADTYGFATEQELFRYCLTEFSSRVDLGMCDEDTYECYKTARELLEKSLDKCFADPEDGFDSYSCKVRSYIGLLIKRGERQTAEEVLRDLTGLGDPSAGFVLNVLSAAQSLALSYIGGDEKNKAKKVINDALNYSGKTLTNKLVNTEYGAEAKETSEFLEDMKTALDNPPEDAPADKVEYLNYYKAYVPKSDRRKIASFEQIAKKAMRIDYSDLDENGLIEKKRELGLRAASGEKPEDLAPEAFALAGEAGYRVLGYKHHFVQFLGAAAMIGGNIAEMQNGEGKTYTIPLAAFLFTLYGRQVHVVDSSEYLCRRNYGWMRGIFEMLGCKAGRLDDPYKADEAVGCDVIYTTVSAECSSLLLANSHATMKELQLSRDVLIADEADSLIDGASQDYDLRTGSKKTHCDFETVFRIAAQAVDRADESGNVGDYYTINEKNIELGFGLFEAVELVSGKSYVELSEQDKNELRWALLACIAVRHTKIKGKDYFIVKSEGKPSIRAKQENVRTGALEPMSQYYEYYILLKEGVPEKDAAEILKSAKEIDQISLWSVVRSFKTVCGATATAASVSGLFEKYYGARVYRIPTNKPVRRAEYPPRLYGTSESKYEAIVDCVRDKAAKGQPVLVVCETTFESVRVHSLLKNEGIDATLLNAENSEDRPQRLAEAGKTGRVTVTTALANRGVDICLGGNHREEAKKELIGEGVDPEELNSAIYSPIDAGNEAKELRNKYNHLCAVWNMRLSKEREKLEELGGLCVIGTACFTDLRLEQQLIGRCARQGSTGESHFFYSFSDESFIRLLGDKSLMYSSLLSEIGFLEVGAGSMGRLLEKSITKMRKNLAQSELGDADRTLDAVFLAPMRERFHAPVYMAAEDGADPKEVLKFVLASTPYFGKCVKSLGKKKKTVESEFLRSLEELGYDLSFRPGQAADKLADLAIEIMKKNGLSSIVNDFIRFLSEREFCMAWTSYIERSKIQYNEINRLNQSESVTKRFVEEFGEASYAEAADLFMKKVITAKVRQKDSPA